MLNDIRLSYDSGGLVRNGNIFLALAEMPLTHSRKSVEIKLSGHAILFSTRATMQFNTSALQVAL